MPAREKERKPMPDKLPENTRVLRFFASDEAARKAVLKKILAAGEVNCREMCKGSEALIILEANAVSGSACRVLLDHCTQEFEDACAGALYGLDGEKLPQAAVDALKAADQLVVAADADTGALLAKRFDACEGVDTVFDFGAQSYKNTRFEEKIEDGGTLAHKGDAYLAAQGRIQTARKLAGADYAAACLPQPGGFILMVGQKKGFWVCALPAAENPGLWLVDMVRRAAYKAPQAAGVRRCAYGDADMPVLEPEEAERLAGPVKTQIYGAAHEAAPVEKEQASAAPRERGRAETVQEDKPERGQGGLGTMLAGLLLVVVVAAVVLAAAWYYSGGDILSLWERSGLRQFNVSGASLL